MDQIEEFAKSQLAQQLLEKIRELEDRIQKCERKLATL